MTATTAHPLGHLTRDSAGAIVDSRDPAATAGTRDTITDTGHMLHLETLALVAVEGIPGLRAALMGVRKACDRQDGPAAFAALRALQAALDDTTRHAGAVLDHATARHGYR